MASAKKRAAKGEAESSYTVRKEQETMLGLPTKPPEKVPEESWLAKLAPQDVRLQRVLAKYRPAAAPEGQMGFGLAFGTVNAANQLDMFNRPTAPEASAPSSRRSNRS